LAGGINDPRTVNRYGARRSRAGLTPAVSVGKVRVGGGVLVVNVRFTPNASPLAFFATTR
jgi:hypothetical protein